MSYNRLLRSNFDLVVSRSTLVVNKKLTAEDAEIAEINNIFSAYSAISAVDLLINKYSLIVCLLFEFFYINLTNRGMVFPFTGVDKLIDVFLAFLAAY